MRDGPPVEALLSDRLWANVQPLLAQYVSPAMGGSRATLDAMLYKALTVQTYQDLAQEDSRWEAVERIHAEWQQFGLLDWLSRVLGVRFEP